jgi:hypothetical protein
VGEQLLADCCADVERGRGVCVTGRCPGEQGVPFPAITSFTADYIDELALDNVLPPGVLGLEDLGVPNPRSIGSGIPLEHLRHYRVGGYDHGVTHGTESTGGAGFR